jgi:hypothetical protein
MSRNTTGAVPGKHSICWSCNKSGEKSFPGIGLY